MLTKLLCCLTALLAACVVVHSEEPWAPVVLRVDTAVVHPDTEVFVYVDDVYRGNLVDGSFRIFLTLEPHDLRVHFPGAEPWEQTLTLTPSDYPGGRTILVAPSRESGGE